MHTSLTICLNGQSLVLESGTTIASLIERQGLAGKRVAVERNREIVPRSEHAQTLVVDGDVIEIVHAIGGG